MSSSSPSSSPPNLPPLPLPAGTTSFYVTHPSSSLRTHCLSAGTPSSPLIILLHGFPETSFSWRRTLPALGAAGYYAVAPDLRGFGRTTGWEDSNDNNSSSSKNGEPVGLAKFAPSVAIRDTVLLVRSLGYTHAHCLVGHDVGARLAALVALARPDLFDRVVLMSHPHGGPPAPAMGTHPDPQAASGALHSVPASAAHAATKPDMRAGLAGLATLPEPRKHYKLYYAGPEAAADLDPAEGLGPFLRGYFHLKSALWRGNDPHPLKGWEAEELAKMPYYYIMPLGVGMREAVRLAMEEQGGNEEVERSKEWLSDEELDVYVDEWKRTGFQGALNWYRVGADPKMQLDLDIFAGAHIRQPCLMLLGNADWGNYQEPGALERMGEVCDKFKGVKMIEGAGHWMQQEKPQAVIDAILDMCKEEGGG